MADDLVSMKRTDDEKSSDIYPIEMPEREDYPYGLKICLTEDEFKKLGIDPNQAAIGHYFELHGRARITAVSHRERDGDKGDCNRVEAQIERLSIDTEDDDEEEEE